MGPWGCRNLGLIQISIPLNTTDPADCSAVHSAAQCVNGNESFWPQWVQQLKTQYVNNKTCLLSPPLKQPEILEWIAVTFIHSKWNLL